MTAVNTVVQQLIAERLEYEQKYSFIFFKHSVLLALLQSLMLAERACVYNMLLNLMETREAGKKTPSNPDYFKKTIVLLEVCITFVRKPECSSVIGNGLVIESWLLCGQN